MQPVQRSQLSFESGGKAISLDCFLPSGNGSRLPAVIGLHGSGGDAEGMAESASLLAAQGFAVYVPHYFERTETTEVASKPVILRNFLPWAKTLWDAISFVVEQPEVDSQRIGLLGFSLGAYLAISVAAMDSRVQAVVEFFGGLPKEVTFFMRRLCPTLILHGDADTVVPVAEAYHLQQVLEKRKIAYEMQIYPGAGHKFSSEVLQDARQRMMAFFQKYLA